MRKQREDGALLHRARGQRGWRHENPKHAGDGEEPPGGRVMQVIVGREHGASRAEIRRQLMSDPAESTSILPDGIPVDVPVVVWLEGADDEACGALFDRFAASHTLLPLGDGAPRAYLLGSRTPLLRLQVARYNEELRRAGEDASVSLDQRPLAPADVLTVAAVQRGEVSLRRDEGTSRRVARVHPTVDALDLFIETAINGTVDYTPVARHGVGGGSGRAQGAGRLVGPRFPLLTYRPARTPWYGAWFPAHTAVEARVRAFNALFVPPTDKTLPHKQTRRRMHPHTVRLVLERRRRRCSNLFHSPFTRRGVRRCGKTAVVEHCHEPYCADCDPGRDWSPSHQRRAQARGLRRSLSDGHRDHVDSLGQEHAAPRIEASTE